MSVGTSKLRPETASPENVGFLANPPARPGDQTRPNQCRGCAQNPKPLHDLLTQMRNAQVDALVTTSPLRYTCHESQLNVQELSLLLLNSPLREPWREGKGRSRQPSCVEKINPIGHRRPAANGAVYVSCPRAITPSKVLYTE